MWNIDIDKCGGIDFLLKCDFPLSCPDFISRFSYAGNDPISTVLHLIALLSGITDMSCQWKVALFFSGVLGEEGVCFAFNGLRRLERNLFLMNLVINSMLSVVEKKYSAVIKAIPQEMVNMVRGMSFYYVPSSFIHDTDFKVKKCTNTIVRGALTSELFPLPLKREHVLTDYPEEIKIRIRHPPSL